MLLLPLAFAPTITVTGPTRSVSSAKFLKSTSRREVITAPISRVSGWGGGGIASSGNAGQPLSLEVQAEPLLDSGQVRDAAGGRCGSSLQLRESSVMQNSPEVEPHASPVRAPRTRCFAQMRSSLKVSVSICLPITDTDVCQSLPFRQRSTAPRRPISVPSRGTQSQSGRTFSRYVTPRSSRNMISASRSRLPAGRSCGLTLVSAISALQIFGVAPPQRHLGQESSASNSRSFACVPAQLSLIRCVREKLGSTPSSAYAFQNTLRPVGALSRTSNRTAPSFAAWKARSQVFNA